MKRALLFLLSGLCVVALVVGFFTWGNWNNAGVPAAISTIKMPGGNKAYLYYMLKESAGFVLARALKGANGQPLGQPRPLMALGNDFGLAESDYVSTMQLSPDGRYLAIDGVQDHGEQVWMYDTERGTISLLPASVEGNFLHWQPSGHTFLYRPMFPLGPAAPMDSAGWHPGLWLVDASTGSYRNIDIGVPSANLVDAVPSPGGSRIVYSTTAGLGMGSDTYLTNLDGSHITHLFSTAEDTNPQAIIGLFAWSPDGKQIAYERLSDSSTPFQPAGLWVMDSHGEQQQRLTDVDGGHGYMPVWSPGGDKIAFVARTNSNDHLADTRMQSLQSAIGVVDVSSHRSWLVASMEQTGRQMNINPSWVMGSASITFTALDPINQVVGGTPRYYTTQIAEPAAKTPLEPITAAIPHFIAVA